MQASIYKGHLISSCSLSKFKPPLPLEWNHEKRPLELELSRLINLAIHESWLKRSKDLQMSRDSLRCSSARLWSLSKSLTRPKASLKVAWKPLEGAAVTRKTPFLAGHALSNFFWSPRLYRSGTSHTPCVRRLLGAFNPQVPSFCFCWPFQSLSLV